jgi:hypothetical protein
MTGSYGCDMACQTSLLAIRRSIKSIETRQTTNWSVGKESHDDAYFINGIYAPRMRRSR